MNKCKEPSREEWKQINNLTILYEASLKTNIEYKSLIDDLNLIISNKDEIINAKIDENKRLNVSLLKCENVNSSQTETIINQDKLISTLNKENSYLKKRVFYGYLKGVGIGVGIVGISYGGYYLYKTLK